MTKKKTWALAGLGVLGLLASFMIFWFYFAKPVSFLTNGQLVKEINRTFPEASASVIQDSISVDERHVVVPFISNEDHYGLSYWVWKRHKWTVETIDTKGEPKIWKINRKDPSSFHLVWNIHPQDQVSFIAYYLIRDRGYQITEGIENYIPRVQMEKKVSLQEKSYGVMELSDEWQWLMNAVIEVELKQKPNLFFDPFTPERNLFLGWIPYDQSDKETFPEGSVNGNVYSNGKMLIEHLMILSKGDLEIP
ncbi:hypothetical protein V7124_25235 [Neobacillus niacini]|uniref:hypothetical protein n=1 Tax=Neobacillus niacini TaxID=86668 RepID=UPI003000C1D8